MAVRSCHSSHGQANQPTGKKIWPLHMLLLKRIRAWHDHGVVAAGHTASAHHRRSAARLRVAAPASPAPHPPMLPRRRDNGPLHPDLAPASRPWTEAGATQRRRTWSPGMPTTRPWGRPGGADRRVAHPILNLQRGGQGRGEEGSGVLGLVLTTHLMSELVPMQSSELAGVRERREGREDSRRALTDAQRRAECRDEARGGELGFRVEGVATYLRRGSSQLSDSIRWLKVICV